LAISAARMWLEKGVYRLMRPRTQSAWRIASEWGARFCGPSGQQPQAVRRISREARGPLGHARQ